MNVLAVFVGGLVGTAMRLSIDALVPHGPTDFPLSTFLVNVAGSFALGLLVARVWPTAPGWLRFGLGTGLLGSFTTFSAVIVSLIELTGTYPLAAAVYLLASLVLGLGAAWLGLTVGRHRPTRITVDE